MVLNFIFTIDPTSYGGLGALGGLTRFLSFEVTRHFQRLTRQETWGQLLDSCPRILASPALQDFNSLLHLLVRLRRLGLFGRVVRGSSIFVLIRYRPIVVRVRDQNIWRDGGILNRFAGGRVVLGNGQNQSGSIRKFHGFLNGSVAEGLVSDNVAASVLKNGGSDNLRRTRRTLIHQHNHGQTGDRLGGIGIKSFPRILLALKVSDSAVIQKKIGSCNTLGFVTLRAVAQVKNEFLCPCLLHRLNLVCHFLRLAFGEGVDVDFRNSFVDDLVGYRRNDNDVASDDNLLRLGTPGADERHGYVRTGCPSEQAANFAD